MSNQETRNYEENVHILLALYRKKTNIDGRARCIRRIEKSENDLQILKRECEVLKGNWRIHRTVNKRSTKKSFNKMQHYMIDHPDCATYFDSMWKTILLQPENRAEKRFMLDIDTTDVVTLSRLMDIVGEPISVAITPSGGQHWIVEPFDRRLVAGIENVTVLTDGYIFITEVKSE